MNLSQNSVFVADSGFNMSYQGLFLYRCYPTTSASVFLAFFSTAPRSPSLYCLFSCSSLYMPIPLRPTFLHSLDIVPTFGVPLILSFLILSSLVTPLIHLNILISATSNFCSCAFFTAHVSAPYIIAGLMKSYHSITYFNNVVKPRHGKQTTLACVWAKFEPQDSKK